MEHTYDKRIIIYPTYIDKKKTIPQGRKISKEHACEDPTPLEILDVCKFLKLPAEIEDKCYSREWWVRGRVRVQLKNEDGTLMNPEYPSRNKLMIRVAELVPKHPGRQKKQQPPPKAQGKGKQSAKKGKKGKR